ncbi:hypothetical protein [Leptospira limi]|uniref:HNH endonuclease n=1 Tax=Leptospira limi TaxID=2950023 RepID=A0ABT3M1S8_9LEPT|nr:hypothetical protein [Leptospira limi]MCW7463715.1 hypothetical protein [Leptospira limi]
MIRIQGIAFDRMKNFCTFCKQAESQSRDHCPSKILLDEPFPTDLSVVPSCIKCNGSFSKDEEYVACAVEFLKSFHYDYDWIMNERVTNILSMKSDLKNQLERTYGNNSRIFKELFIDDRFENVLIKNALGHIRFELGLYVEQIPKELKMNFLPRMDDTFKNQFESFVGEPDLFPEVGSRLLIRLFERQNLDERGWIVVQNGVYRFQLQQSVDSIKVKIVMKEFLAAEIHFDCEL